MNRNISTLNGKRVSEELASHAGNGTNFQLRQLAILREITLAINPSLELQAVLDSLLEKIVQLLPYAASTVHLLDDNGELKPLACRNIRMEDWRASYGAGFVKEILERKVPVVSLDVQYDPRSRGPAFFRKYGLVSFIAIPLILKEKVIGVLSFYTKTQHAFSKDEIAFLSTMAGLAAIVIHTSLLYEETKKQQTANATLVQALEKHAAQAKAVNKFLSALHSISSIASRSLDLNAILKEVIKKITEIFGFNCTRIFLLDSNAKELTLKASFETRPEFYIKNKVFQIGQGIIGKVVQTGRPLLFENVARDPRYRKLSQSKTNLRNGLHFFAVFPIKTKSKTVGCIDFSGQDARELSRDEIRLIKSMISHIGVAVENVKLFDTAQDKVEELSAMYSLAQVVNTSLNCESLLRRIMNEVLTMFKFDAGRVYLYDSDSNSITVVADRGFPADLVPQIRGLLGRVIQKEQPHFFEDIQNDPNYRQWSKHNFVLKAGFQSGFYLPVRAKGKVVGVIVCLSRSIHRFSPNEVRLIDCIVDYLGTAVENTRLYEATDRSRRQLQSLAERMQLAREEERARLARQLHDELGQSLAALKMVVEAFITGSGQNGDLRRPSKKEVFKLIDTTVKTVRRLGKNLRPTMLDELDLTASFERNAREFQERTGVRCRIRSNVKHQTLDESRAIAVLRICKKR